MTEPRLRGVLETVLYHEPSEGEEMLRLYRDVLGLTVVASWSDGRALRIGTGVVLLFDRSAIAGREEPIADHGTIGPSHTAFLASPESYDAWADRLAEAGIEVVHEEDWGGGRRSLYFRDPARNLIEIAGGDIWPEPAGGSEADERAAADSGRGARPGAALDTG